MSWPHYITANCVCCGEEATSWTLHIHVEGRSVTAGWCESCTPGWSFLVPNKGEHFCQSGWGYAHHSCGGFNWEGQPISIDKMKVWRRGSPGPPFDRFESLE